MWRRDLPEHDHDPVIALGTTQAVLSGNEVVYFSIRYSDKMSKIIHLADQSKALLSDGFGIYSRQDPIIPDFIEVIGQDVYHEPTDELYSL